MMTKMVRRDGDTALDRAHAYAALLEEYFAAPGEAPRRRAYEAGRDAIASNLGILEISAIHHDVLASVLEDGSAIGPRVRLAHELFAEILSPYEMTHRGFQEALAALRQMNETLEQEIHRIAHAVHDDAGQLLTVARLALSGLASDVSPSSQSRLEEVTALLDRVDQQLRRRRGSVRARAGGHDHCEGDAGRLEGRGVVSGAEIPRPVGPARPRLCTRRNCSEPG